MWVLLGLASALLNSTSDVFLKVANRPSGDPPRAVDPSLGGFFLYGLTALITLPIVYATEGAPRFNPLDAWPIVVSSVLNIFATICYVRAMQDAPLSLTTPLMAITPACLLVTGPLIAGDRPNLLGGCGVVLCAVGIYISNLEKGMPWHGPFRAVWKNRGQRDMLIATITFSFTSTLERRGIDRIGVGWSLVGLTVIVSLGLLPGTILALRRQSAIPSLRYALASAAAVTGSVWAQFAAVTLAPVAYVICLKRLSTIFGPLLGILFLGERQAPGRRLLGSLFLFAGVVVIALTSLSD